METIDPDSDSFEKKKNSNLFYVETKNRSKFYFKREIFSLTRSEMKTMDKRS